MALFNFRREAQPTNITAEVEAFLKGYSIEVMPRTAEKVEDFRAISAARHPRLYRAYRRHPDRGNGRHRQARECRRVFR